ncbi:MAG: DUF3352 domain-containing protein [Gemmataceae bacterium]
MLSTRLLASTLLPLVFALAARGETPQPLRFVPEQANLVVRVEKPRQLVETVLNLPAVKEALQLPFAREQLDSPTVQRFLQLLAYSEKDLGVAWPEILDKLAGHGLTLATRAGGNNDPVLIIADGTDPEFTRKFLQLAISMIEQELAREESKEKVEKKTYRGIDGYKIGDAHFTQVGGALLLSNKKEAMQAAIDTHLDKKKSLADVKGPNDARKAVPANSLAWLWLDLDVARKAPNAKETFALPGNDIIQMLLAGGTINAVGRAPFLAVGLHHTGDTLGLALRLPGGGRQGLPEVLALHIPPRDAPAPPLLETQGVILSHCLYLDLNTLYTKRAQLFNEKLAKQFEDAEKGANPVLPGTTLAKLYAQAGPYFRFVVAHQEKVGYGVKPKQYVPAFALVNSMRDPQFAKSIEGVLRAAALLAGSQANLKLVEETHAGVKIVGYRFPEKGTLAADPENLRFNFSPCFCSVGNQFAACSTLEFCRDVIDALQKEQKSSQQPAEPIGLRTRVYASGGAALLKAFEDQVLGQIILDQAVKPAEAHKQLAQLMAFVQRLGRGELRIESAATEYRLDLEWQMKK